MRVKLYRGQIGFRYDLGLCFVGKFIGSIKSEPHYGFGVILFGNNKAYLKLKNKPVIKSLVFWNIVLIVPIILWTILTYTVIPIYLYFIGLYDFITDTFYTTSLDNSGLIFNWINFLGFIAFLIIFLIK